jgi:hypothetical protein
MTELLQDVFSALDIEPVPTKIGSLKINRKRGKDNVQIKLDPARLFGIMVTALLSLNEEATLDFLAKLDQDGLFPQQELLGAINQETNKPENVMTIEYGGSGTFFGDKLYRIKRSELV